ncbi:SDR family oxidoreductase [Terrimonas sp. NA20]|uniref:SDR family oxidoreductase n=1 Tax=Terrimonas ginsenosidimutans TaxID=2908004 RepID=A0ABS9KTY0_9BACT|nr:SDR family oxidoreductase [Terrimonas ginsenosidimutans]MCG2615745.1 SDR family oxidoreductase [Terrimonas ginsenosidimutans]
MKIVVIGGTGLIGARLVKLLRSQGHDVIAASPISGVNTITGEGLAKSFEGAYSVVDVSNSPSLEPDAAVHFFETSGKNLVDAGKKAGIKHHVVLSIVGTDRLQESGYFRGKLAQENMLKASGIPYTILRSTQFHEFAGTIANGSSIGKYVHLPHTSVQTIAADDVAAMLAEIAVAGPLDETIEIAGPEKMGMDEFIRKYLKGINDERQVITDERATYLGISVDDRSLVPGEHPTLGKILFEDWLKTQ